MDEIEEFLRKVAARRKSAAQQPPPTNVEYSDIEYVEPEVIEAEPVRELSSLGRRHLDTSDVTEHSHQLGQRAASADDRMESHLHRAFDHRLGSIAGSSDRVVSDYEDSEATPYAVHEMAASLNMLQILKLFRNPNTMRQAVILSEILKRPEL